ncbi:SIR2 family protein [Paenibacillus sp. FSL P4-0176]|uniref:SIR2 family protein n=1 Tax=Paenibacillus sp. FSL P4-0176 TaxID=2921631 RepID=UPI0030CE1633
MQELTIEHLAYLLKEAKENDKPQPIFFLGAGASRSGNIPLTQEIINDILKKHPNSPFVKDLDEKQRTYASLMNCLTPHERNELLKGYIDKAKINVTHIYLAQLLQEGFVDYILTVNFDNLMLRALAMFNIFPSTYDMAILKDLTTTTFKEKSVVYLHGQSHGLWLLNTPEEMSKVKTIIPRIFDSIKNERPWIFIGYSGEDPVFEHIKKLGRFDNSLYWITYNDESPKPQVEKFISDPHTNAFLIKGYDSDSFMLKLNSELGLEQPRIVDKPFTALLEMLQEIVDIDEKEHFQGVKERLEIAKRQVSEAKQQYEMGDVITVSDIVEFDIDKLKKEIINLMIDKDYDKEKISIIEEKVKETNDNTLRELMSGLYNNWGIALKNLARGKEGEEREKLYQQAFEKHEKSIEIKPDKHEAYNSWGIALKNLAESREGEEREKLYQQAFEKYEKSIEIKPEKHEAYNNWGIALEKLAETREGEEREKLYQQAFEKYEKSIEIKPDKDEAYNNWGIALKNLAESREGEDKEKLYQQAFEKHEKSIEIKPDKHEAYHCWGVALQLLAKSRKGKEREKLFQRAFEKYEKSIEIKPDKHESYNNWGNALQLLAESREGKEREKLYQQAFKKYEKSIEIKPDKHETYNNWGIALKKLAKGREGEEREKLYQEAFEKYEKSIEIKPDLYGVYFSWGSMLGDLAESKEGKEAEVLFQQAFMKYEKAVEFNPDMHEAYINWGIDMENLAKRKEGKEADHLYQQVSRLKAKSEVIQNTKSVI